jgi:hypothetical protein
MYGVFEIFWKIRGRTGSRRYLRNMNLFIYFKKLKLKLKPSRRPSGAFKSMFSEGKFWEFEI